MQSLRASLPEAATYLPAGQLVQLDTPPVLYLPVSHKPEQDELVAPRIEPNRPAAHAIQSDDESLPLVETYRPAWHRMQSSDESLPVVATYRPATQSIQLEAPLLEYVPA